MNKKIKILHLANPINKNDFVDTIVRFLDPNRFEVIACTFSSQNNISDPKYKEIGIKHFVLGIKGRQDYLKAIYLLISIVKKEKIDIIHTHHFDEAFLGGLVRLLLLKIKLVVGRHYSDELYLTSKGFHLKKSLMVEKFANSMADAIIAPSTYIVNILRKQNVSKDKIHFVTYGFDFSSDKYTIETDEGNLKEELGLKNEFLVGNFGRHYFLKGQEYLILAFKDFLKKNPNSKLLMVGDGPYSHILRGMVKDLLLEENVLFLGWRRDGYKLISLVDVIVHPTLTEAFPQIMIETMVSSKPLMITSVSGASDQISHLENGYLIEMRSKNSIVEGLNWVFDNRDSAKEVGKKAKEKVLAQLDIRKVIKDYEKVYYSIV